MSKKKIIIISITVLIVIAVVVSLNLRKSGNEALEVQTAKVKRNKIVQTVTATGKIQPKTQVKISADVAGKITRLEVKEGDWVEKGQFLVALDRARYQAEVERSEANLRSIEANALLARENMLKAEKDYKRTKELFDKDLESQAGLDQIYAQAEVEKARYKSALELVEQAKAALKQARDDLSKTTIYSPMSGTISELNKEVGEIALGSQFQEDVIMVVSNLSGMEALVDVDENDIVSVSIGDTARIEVDALPDIILTGVVAEIANSAKITAAGSADQKTEFEVKVSIDGQVDAAKKSSISISNTEVKYSNVTADLRPGMTATSEIITDTRYDALSIPIQSVAVRTVEQLNDKAPQPQPASDTAIAGEMQEQEFIPDKDGFVEIVWIIQEGIAHARQVKTGIQSETHIEIVEGISEDETIVVGNFRAISKDLQNGSKVKAKQEQLASR
jgi:HlyD family secretion protein